MELAGLCITAIIALLALTVALLVWGLYLSYTNRLSEKYQRHKKHLETLEMQWSERFRSMQEENKKLRNHLSEKLAAEEGEQQAYRRAEQLAGQGAAPETIAATCGLSRSEADLILWVNRYQSPENIALSPMHSQISKKGLRYSTSA